MMTKEQWYEIVEWVSDRFPNKPWVAEQALAYFADLKDHDPSDVWSALYHLYEQGQAFAPNGSQLLARAGEERRRAARDDMYRQGLPAPVSPREPAAVDKTTTYAERRFNDGPMTGRQLIERIHANRPASGCGNPDCADHHRVPA